MSDNSATRKRMALEVMKRCAAPIKRNAKPIRKLIRCGQQGCVYKSSEHTVIKVTPVGEAKIKKAPTRRSHTKKATPDETAIRDYLGTGWIKNHQASVSIEGPQPALPHIGRIFSVKDCLAGTKIKRAFVVEREDLEDIPKEWRKWFHKPFTRDRDGPMDVIDLLIRLEDAMNDGTYPRDWARGKEPREWILRLRRSGNFVAWFLFREIFDLQEWLSHRKAMMFDLLVDNLGIRKYGGGQRQVVVRDTGCIAAMPTRGLPREFPEKTARKHTQAIGAPPFPW